MEKTKECIEKGLNLLNIQREKKEVILKEEQEKAVVELLSGKDVLAILPTGFGKRLTYCPLPKCFPCFPWPLLERNSRFSWLPYSFGLSSIEDFALRRKLKWEEGAWTFQIHHLPCLTAKGAARCADPDSVLTQWTRTAPQHFALFLHRHCRHVQMMLLTSQCSANGAFWRPLRVHGLETFTTIIYEFLEKLPNFCFRLIRQSLHSHRWRFFPWILVRVWKAFLAYPPPSAIEAFISLLLCVLCEDFVIFPLGHAKRSQLVRITSPFMGLVNLISSSKATKVGGIQKG